MEKGEGRGTGNFLELEGGLARSGGGQQAPRGKWALHASKEDDVINKVIGKSKYFYYTQTAQ